MTFCLIPDPDIQAAPAATLCSSVMTSEQPMTVLPVGIFPADVIDVVFEHPVVEVSTLTEMLLARSKAGISSQQRGNEKALLNVAVLISQRAVDAIILRQQWNGDNDQTCAGDVITYQEAVRVAVAAYRRQMSCNPRF